MTLPEPELADGAVEAGERLLPVLELPVLELPVLELPVLELPVLELPVLELPVLELPVLELPVAPAAELPDVPVLPAVAVEPELPEVVCCAPGSANATAPAATTPSTPAVAVTVRSRACPRSRSAIARLVCCECPLIG